MSAAWLGTSNTALGQNALSVAPLNLTFTSMNGRPDPQTVTISTAMGTQGFTATTSSIGNWLSVFPTGGTASTAPVLLSVAVGNPNLALGTYPGSITIAPTSGTQAPIIIQATYNVVTPGGNPGGTFSANPNPVAISVAAGTPSFIQSIQLSNSGSTANVNLASSVTWLQVSQTGVAVNPGSPTNVSVTVVPGAMPAATYNGSISVTLQGSATTVLSIPVSLTITPAMMGTGLSGSAASLSYTVTAGSLQPANQQIQITTTSNALVNGTATVAVANGSGWLSVVPSTFSISSSNPQILQVTVSPANLVAGTGYSGSLLVTTIDGGSFTVPVSVNGGSGGMMGNTLTASPSPLNISIPTGSTATVNQALSVNIANASAMFTAQAVGLSWVTVNPPSQTVTAGTAATLTISANPTGQTSGQYLANIVLTPQGGATPLSVPVNITIGTAPSLIITPANGGPAFSFQTGTAFPAAQNITIASSGAPLAFSVSASTTSGGNWLVVTPQTGATNASGGVPTNITVQINPSGLAVARYQGTITVTAAGAPNSPQIIPVTLQVSSLPILQLNSPSVTFNYQFSSATQPTQQQIQVSSSGNPLDYQVSTAPGSGGNFLQVTPASGTTPGTLNLSLNPSILSGLAPGIYTSSITLSSVAAGNTPLTIPVTLVIGNTTLLNVSQTSLNFNYQTVKPAPAIQTFSVSSTGAPISYGVSVLSTNCGGNFLTVTPAGGTTPGTVAVGINIGGLVAGTCTGTVTLTSTSAGIGNSPLIIPVTLKVSDTPLLDVSPRAVSVTTQVGNSPANQTIAVTSTDSGTAIPFTVTSTTNTGAGWLLVGPTGGNTPTNLTVGFQTVGLPVGTYTGSITVTPSTAGTSPVVIPVTVVISSSNTAASTPQSLVFAQPFNGPAPAAQTIAVSSTIAGLSFAASATTFSGGNWLAVTPAGGTTPGSVTVSVNGTNLGQGPYTGVVTIVIPGASNTPLNIPVTLNIGSPQSLSVTPATLSFAYQSGTATGPAAQALQVASTGGSIPFTVTTTSTPASLIVATPASGNTPNSVAVSLNQAILSTLATGSYTGTVTILSSAGGSQTISVSVTVGAPPPPGSISITNAASGLGGPIAPGEIVAIFGINLGPAVGVGLQLVNGTVSTILANTVVTFDGIQAPLIYVSANQINAIVPYEINGRVNTSVSVQRNGLSSPPVLYNVAPTAPAIFSASQGGNGQGAILNSNNTFNSVNNPAIKGTVVQIYATGEGALNPAVATGSVTSSTGPAFPKPQGNVTVTIGGQPAQIVYAGEAPGLVSGVLQVNAVVPTSLIGTGPQIVILTVGAGTNNNLQTISVAVQ